MPLAVYNLASLTEPSNIVGSACGFQHVALHRVSCVAPRRVESCCAVLCCAVLHCIALRNGAARCNSTLRAAWARRDARVCGLQRPARPPRSDARAHSGTAGEPGHALQGAVQGSDEAASPTHVRACARVICRSCAWLGPALRFRALSCHCRCCCVFCLRCLRCLRCLFVCLCTDTHPQVAPMFRGFRQHDAQATRCYPMLSDVIRSDSPPRQPAMWHRTAPRGQPCCIAAERSALLQRLRCHKYHNCRRPETITPNP